MSPSRLNAEEIFEDQYTEAFKGRFRGRGVVVKYERDRAARDLGIHLTAPGALEFSSVRVWFQLKGVHRGTRRAEALDRGNTIPVKLDLEDVRHWYAAPEAVYVVLYLEESEEFVGEDIRELVDRRFSDYRNPGAKLGDLNQRTITLRVNASAVIDEERISLMLRHRAMRIDGPSWRGRPLGHKFDPLRSELATLEPAFFVELVEALLSAHDFELEDRLDARDLLAGVREGGSEAFLAIGTMRSTYEWPFSMSVEYGSSPGSAFREDGDLLRVQGRTAVLVQSRLHDHPRASENGDAVLADLARRNVERVLVIANAPEALLLGSYRSVLGDMYMLPQGHAGLAYSVLCAPLVFMEFQDRLRWKFVNFLWTQPDRKRVSLRAGHPGPLAGGEQPPAE